MKKLFFIILALIGLTSCSDEPSQVFKDVQINLMRSSKVIAYSGDNIFGSKSRSSENAYFERWQSDRSWDKPHDIILSEWEYVQKYLAENPNGGYKSVDCNDYIIQVVGGGNHTYEGDTPDHNGALHTINNATSQMDYCCIDGFFTQFNNTGMNSENVIRLVGVNATDATYRDSNASLTQSDLYAFYFITFPDTEEYGYMAGKTGCYLCYDYATYKDSEKWGVTADGIYDDWVIKLTKSDGSDWENSDNSETPIPEDVFGEVETNLHAGDNNDSHLSIHIRAALDVEIFIPVPVEYYCEADDMEIVQKHETDFFIHGGPERVTYNINNIEVALNIKYEEKGIRIWTEGITEELIEYLQEQFNDGITFEIWNYFNIDKELLKTYLNQATIKFLNGKPDSYYCSKPDEDDCDVTEIE